MCSGTLSECHLAQCRPENAIIMGNIIEENAQIPGIQHQRSVAECGYMRLDRI